MTALYIILGILLLLFLLSLLRIGIRAELGEETRLTVIAGPARIQVLPKAEKPKREKKPKKKKAEAPPPPTEEKKKKKLPLTAQDVKTLLPAVWQSLKGGLRKTRQRLRIDPLTLSASLPGAEDPAGAAELYGYINAGMWTVMPQLEQLTNIPDPHLHVEVDFDGVELKLTGTVGAMMQLRDLFTVGTAFAKPLIRWFFALRRRQSAQEKARAKAEKKSAEQAPRSGAEHTDTSTSTKEK